MYYLGIDVGGMSVKVGIVDEKGNILLKDKFETGIMLRKIAFFV
jgi:predicted NBD/HSP70 family sugar kinase